jgi:transcriptional regulator with XRE-family HTH domain
MRTGPECYTEGLAEVIRGFRLYVGLSKDALAERIGMATRTYERIEYGERDCPPGLLDTLQAMVVEFDTEVERVVDAAAGGEYGDHLAIPVSPLKEWERCVVARAAMMSPKITPVLVR